jgi:hypothetical protein
MGNQQAVRLKPPQQSGVDRGAERTRLPVQSHDRIERGFAIGNQASARLRPGHAESGPSARTLQGTGSAPHEVAASAAPPRSARAPFLLQRKCACGGGATECDECRSRKAAGLQTKLQIGEAGDEYEQEADRVAAQVTAAPDRRVAAKPDIRRINGSFASAQGAAPPSVEHVLARTGVPLEPTLRQWMEQRFDRDFSNVRVHEGADAALSAHDVNAVAYTVGSHIVFGANRFAPATGEGHRLLAHELTHVVQQTGSPKLRATPGPGAARDCGTPAAASHSHLHLQRQPADGHSEPAFDREIQWGYYDLFGTPDQYTFADVGVQITFNSEARRRRVSDTDVAEGCVAAIERRSELKFAVGRREALARSIEQTLGKMPYKLSYTLNVYGTLGWSRWRSFFTPESFKKHISDLLADPNANKDVFLIFLHAGFAIDEPPSPPSKPKTEPQPDAWVTDQQNAVQMRIDAERKRQDRPLHLPDRIVLWHNESDSKWYLNVWLHFDPQGKNRAGKAILLKPDEPAEKLYERALEAADQALAESRGEQRKRREAEMPDWAVHIKAGVEKALGSKKARDIPDGIALTLDGRGVKTRGPGREGFAQEESATSKAIDKQVLLQIWIERPRLTKGKPADVNYGVVPIFPKIDGDSEALAALVKYVRNLAAILREFEDVPDGLEITPWQAAREQMLPPFEAKILATDLRPDNITVIGAHNAFSMFLDYEKQYKSGKGNDIFIASKLYNQPIFFHWKIFNAPAEPVAANVPQKWEGAGGRWEQLYDRYNPGSDVTGSGDIKATTTAGKVPTPPEGFDTGGTDTSTRVSFSDEPGDYLVYCETTHRPIGEADLKRVSSFAYYPVRTQTKETIATPLITQVSTGLAAADADLANIEQELAKGTHTDIETKVLKVEQESTRRQHDVLQARETGGLVAATQKEIQDGKERLRVATALNDILPTILAAAKSNAAVGQEPTQPSKLLEDKPELLDLYFWLMSQHKTAAGYVRELTAQVKELQGVLERATEYQDEFKAGGCIYTPEALFLSKVDGHIYPLTLMIGEAPVHSSFSSRLVAYTLVDVTTPETKKRYRGDPKEEHSEAIDSAFEKFGEAATYGEGWIAVRMPAGGPGKDCAEHRPKGAGIDYYKSEVGLLDKVLKVLTFLAAYVGVAALLLTGFGAALAGAFAVIIGAIAAARNIADRDDRHALELDAELVMDVMAIIGVAEFGASARLAQLQRAARGFTAYERVAGKFIAAYRLGAEGATAILIPLKMKEDVDKINALPISDEEKHKLIEQALGGTIISGVMALTMSAHSRVIERVGGKVLPLEEDYAAVREQVQLAALEHPAGDKSMLQEKGWIDAEGNWTEKAPQTIRDALERAPPSEPGEPAPRREPAKAGRPPAGKPEPVSKEAQHAVDMANEQLRSGQTQVEGSTPGHREVPLHGDGEGHTIKEVEDERGIHCELFSPTGETVPCADGLGEPATAAPLTPEPPAERQAPREETPGEPAPTGEKPATSPPVTGEGAPAAPPPQEQERIDALNKIDALRAKIAANNQKIKTLDPELAKAQAELRVADDEFGSKSRGNDQTPEGRAVKKAWKDAKKKYDAALKRVNDIENERRGYQKENTGYYEQRKALDEFLNPRAMTTAEKGVIGETEARKFMESDEPKYMKGEDVRLGRPKQKYKFIGSSQQPVKGDPKPQGLDGVYEGTNPKNVVIEAKYDTSQLREGQDEVEWVDDRLEQAVGWTNAERIRREGYEYWVVRYNPRNKGVEATRIFVQPPRVRTLK